MQNIQVNPEPQYWNLLSHDDKSAYAQLRSALSSPACKNRRNKSIATFSEIVDAIHKYVEKGDGNDNKRSLVCGITWIDDGIAINTHQLRLLINKCKSSINGSFQAMGYGTIPTASDSASQIIQKFPFLKNNFSELRQWTVRKLITNSDLSDSLSEIVSKSTRDSTSTPNMTPPSSLEDAASLNSDGISLSISPSSRFLDHSPSIEQSSFSNDKEVISDFDQINKNLLMDSYSPIHDIFEDPFSFIDRSSNPWGDDLGDYNSNNLWN